MKSDHVGVSNQGLVWVGIMSPQGLQERKLSEQRSRQPSSPGPSVIPQGLQDKDRLQRLGPLALAV